MESRKFISDHCVREGGDARYAVKILSNEVVQNLPTFFQGTIDMAIETRFLSDIEHPNIIKMRACASISPFKPGYFIGKSLHHHHLQCIFCFAFRDNSPHYCSNIPRR